MKTKIANEMVILVCDDIRPEIGGKSSYMGVYSDTIVVRKVPLVLPKMAFAILIFNTKIKITKMEPIIKHPKGQIKLSPPEFQDGVPKGANLNIHLFVAPLKIEESGEMELQIVFNENETLKVTHSFEIKIDPGSQV